MSTGQQLSTGQMPTRHLSYLYHSLVLGEPKGRYH